MDSIQLIYIALFGRPADPIGLAHFTEVTNGGQDLTRIGDLSGEAEYQRRFAGDDNSTIIIEIYEELFERTPSSAEVQGWLARMQGPNAFNTSNIAIAIAQSAQNEDKAILEAKVEAANQFTAAVQADNDAFAAYRGPDGEAFGRAFLDQIDQATDTLTDEQVAAQVEAFGDGEAVPGLPTPNDPKTTFTLTTGDDFADQAGSVRNDGDIASDFRFTTGNETVVATSDTLTFGDTLSDSSTLDNDVLQLTLNDSVGGSPIITNIETFNITATSGGGTFNLVDVSGVETINISGTPTGEVRLANAANSGIATVNASGLASVAGSLFVDFGGQTSAVTVTGGAGGDGIYGGNGADTISGGGGFDVLSGRAGVDTISGGASGDVIDGGNNNDVLNGEAGADLIIVGNGNDTVTGGAGGDTIVLGTVGAIAVDDFQAGDAGADDTGTETVTYSDGFFQFTDDTSGADAIDDSFFRPVDDADFAGAAPTAAVVSAGSNTVVFEATASDNGNDAIYGFNAGSVAAGGDVLNVSAFLGAAVSRQVVDADDGLDDNATGSNVVIIEGNWTDVVEFDANASFLLVSDNTTDTFVSYVTTDANGFIASSTTVATLVGVGDATLLTDANFA